MQADIEDLKKVICEGEVKLEEQKSMIEELEKRREAAKREIKQMHAKLNKRPQEEQKISLPSKAMTETDLEPH